MEDIAKEDLLLAWQKVKNHCEQRKREKTGRSCPLYNACEWKNCEGTPPLSKRILKAMRNGTKVRLDGNVYDYISEFSLVCDRRFGRVKGPYYRVCLMDKNQNSLTAAPPSAIEILDGEPMNQTPKEAEDAHIEASLVVEKSLAPVEKQKPVEKPEPVEKQEHFEKPEERAGCPYAAIMAAYLELCPSLPGIRRIDGKRKTAVAARWRAYPSLETFRELFEIAENSAFLKGQNDRDWTADFDWLMRATNFAKVLERKYDKTGAPKKEVGREGSFDTDEFFAAALRRTYGGADKP